MLCTWMRMYITAHSSSRFLNKRFRSSKYIITPSCRTHTLATPEKLCQKRNWYESNFALSPITCSLKGTFSAFVSLRGSASWALLPLSGWVDANYIDLEPFRSIHSVVGCKPCWGGVSIVVGSACIGVEKLPSRSVWTECPAVVSFRSDDIFQEFAKALQDTKFYNINMMSYPLDHLTYLVIHFVTTSVFHVGKIKVKRDQRRARFYPGKQSLPRLLVFMSFLIY